MSSYELGGETNRIFCQLAQNIHQIARERVTHAIVEAYTALDYGRGRGEHISQPTTLDGGTVRRGLRRWLL